MHNKIGLQKERTNPNSTKLFAIVVLTAINYLQLCLFSHQKTLEHVVKPQQ
jgi:hypothetical protein